MLQQFVHVAHSKMFPLTGVILLLCFFFFAFFLFWQPTSWPPINAVPLTGGRWGNQGHNPCVQLCCLYYPLVLLLQYLLSYSCPLYPFFLRGQNNLSPSILSCITRLPLFVSFLSLNTADILHFSCTPASPSSLTSIHSLFCHLARFEVDPSICLWLRRQGCGEGGCVEGGGGGSDADSSSSRYLIKMAVRAHCNYWSACHATTLACLCASLHVCVCVWRWMPLPMCERVSVLILLDWECLISDSPQRPAMTCLPHTTHCPQNTDRRNRWNWLLCVHLDIKQHSATSVSWMQMVIHFKIQNTVSDALSRAIL